MNVTLPDLLYASAEVLATRAGFPTVDDYIADLIQQDLERRQQASGGEDWLEELVRGRCPSAGGDDSERALVRQELRERVVTLLDEGVASGPSTPMTAEDWEAIRREVRGRSQERGS
jgi:hypothetical protein